LLVSMLTLSSSCLGGDAKTTRTHNEEIAHTNARRDAYRARLRAASRRAWAQVQAAEERYWQQEIAYANALTALQQAQGAGKPYNTNKSFVPHKHAAR
jgi:hypothetical protein